MRQIACYLFLAAATLAMSGCGGCACATFSGVKVTNATPDLVFVVTAATAYDPLDEDTPPRKLGPGGEWFVPAALYLDQQNVVVTVKAYTKGGTFITQRSQSFHFSSYYPRIDFWDVKKSDLGIY